MNGLMKSATSSHAGTGHKVQESWQEFKEKANPTFEQAFSHLTDSAVRLDLKAVGNQLRSIWSNYRTWIVGAAVLMIVQGLIKKR